MSSTYRLRAADESKNNDYGYDCNENEYRIAVRLLSGVIMMFCASHGETILDLKKIIAQTLDDKPGVSQIIISTIDPATDQIVMMSNNDLITQSLEVSAFIRPPTKMSQFLLKLDEMSLETPSITKHISKIFNINRKTQSFDMEYDPKTATPSQYPYKYVVRVFYNEGDFRVQFLYRTLYDHTVDHNNNKMNQFIPSVSSLPNCELNIYTQEELEKRVVEMLTSFYDLVLHTLSNFDNLPLSLKNGNMFRGTRENPSVFLNFGKNNKKSLKKNRKSIKKNRKSHKL